MHILKDEQWMQFIFLRWFRPVNRTRQILERLGGIPPSVLNLLGTVEFCAGLFLCTA